MIRDTFRANLQPWQDQPAPVQQRLRLLQIAMTEDTLRNCQARGLIDPTQVRSLIEELGLSSSPGSNKAEPVLDQPPSGSETASPAPSPSPTRP
jgi:hypothetical protein